MRHLCPLFPRTLKEGPLTLYKIRQSWVGVLDRLRGRLQGSLQRIGSVFSRAGVSPTAWTVFGLALALLAGASYSLSGYRYEALGGLLILVAGFFDIVDGAVARVTGKTSKRGAFLDSTLDRVAEVALFAGILLGGYSTPILVLAGLSGSMLVSYTRAKGDALGVALSGVGIGERSERLLVLAAASLLGLLWWGVILVIVIAWFTFLDRSARAARSLS